MRLVQVRLLPQALQCHLHIPLIIWLLLAVAVEVQAVVAQAVIQVLQPPLLTEPTIQLPLVVAQVVVCQPEGLVQVKAVREMDRLLDQLHQHPVVAQVVVTD
jgi:hypothetical protein